MTQDDELIGLTEIVKEFKLSDRTLRNAAQEGVLEAKKIAGVWLVSRAEIRRYIKENKRPVGRPSTKRK